MKKENFKWSFHYDSDEDGVKGKVIEFIVGILAITIGVALFVGVVILMAMVFAILPWFLWPYIFPLVVISYWKWVAIIIFIRFIVILIKGLKIKVEK